MYTIKQVCEQLNMTPHTVRHYTDMGIIPSLQRDKNGNRLFDEESVNWLLATKFLRESGMSIQEIRHYFDLCLEGDQTFDERYEILTQLHRKLLAEQKNVQSRLECVADKLNHCKEIKKGKCRDDCNPLNW